MYRINRNFIGLVVLTACIFTALLIVVTAMDFGQGRGTVWADYNPLDYHIPMLFLGCVAASVWVGLMMGDCFPWPVLRRRTKITSIPSRDTDDAWNRIELPEARTVKDGD